MCWRSIIALRFNLDKLEALSKGDAKLLQLILDHFFKKGRQSAYHKYTRYNRAELYGKSFLVNPKPLLEDKLTDPGYVAQYIRLAARRSYLLYKVYNVSYLDLSSFPEVDISQISHNPLLKIAHNKVYFKYEEN